MGLGLEHGTERETLEAHLDGMRATAARKVTGVSWADATRQLGPTPTSMAGILKHLANVERWWFRHNLAGEQDVPFDWTDEDPDGEFAMAPGDSVDVLLEQYAAACARSRAIAAEHGLDDLSARAWHGEGHPSLRWIYVHMIEETARHNGHLDIYRELIDGQTDREL